MNRAQWVAVLFLAACAPEAHVAVPPPTPAQSPSSTPSAALPSAPARSATLVPSATPPPAPSVFSSWSDPPGLDALTLDCHATHPAPVSHERDPLACRLPFDQSCVHDPCFTKHEDCRAACGTTCGSCDSACGGVCDACKLTCKDDACRRACASSAATCKQTCLTSLDECASATCATADACFDDEMAKWRAHHCSCRKIAPCTERCLKASDKPGYTAEDAQGCLTRCAAHFPGCDVEYCVMGWGPDGKG